MQKESGFFYPVEGVEPLMGEMNLLYGSVSGPCQLHRATKDGTYRVYKSLKPEFRGHPVYETMLRKEYEIGYALEHPSICRVYGFLDLPDLGHCIEMEWVDSRTLEVFFKENPSSGQVLKVFSEICDALDYMHHKQVVHKDLKPGNILVTFNGDNVRLIDFGVSDTDAHYLSKYPAGTVPYAAPELLAGDPLDFRSDYYSLGVIMKEFGVFPRAASRCMRLRPSERPRNAQEIRRLLTSRRSPWVYAALLVLTALVVLAIALYIKPSDDALYDGNEAFDIATEAIERADSGNLSSE